MGLLVQKFLEKLTVDNVKKKILLILSASIVVSGLFLTLQALDLIDEMRIKNNNLQNKIIKIEEEARVNNLNRDTMCHPSTNAVPQYIDCGESFSPRWATCVCTTWCLEDYAMSYSNRDISNCKDWNAPQKIKVEPAAEEDEDDDEEDEE